MLIWLLIFISLPLDALTGYFVNKGIGFAIFSSIGKGALIIFIFFYLLMYNLRYALIIFSGAFVLLGSIFLQAIGKIEFLYISSVYNILKLLLPFSIFYFLFASRPDESNFHNRNIVLTKYSLTFFSIFYLANILVGVMGYGYSTYQFEEFSFGTKGFFYSGNEVSGLLIILCGYSLTRLCNAHIASYMLVSGIFIYAGIRIGTKVSVLSPILLAIFAYLFKNTRRGILFYARAGMLSLSLILFIFVSFLVFDISTIHSPIMERAFMVMRETDFLSSALSGRDIYLRQVADFLYDNATPLDLIAGPGQAYLDFNTSKGSVEIDLVDSYLWFGIPGAFSFVMWTLILIRKNTANKISLSNYGSHFSIIFLTVAVSFLSGHIFISGMLAIPLMLYIYYSYYEKLPVKLSVIASEKRRIYHEK